MINPYVPGDWNVQCDICDRKVLYSTTRMTWDGYLACYTTRKCWYPKHICDEPPPVIVDGLPVPIARPPQTDVFTNNGTNGGRSRWGSTWFVSPSTDLPSGLTITNPVWGSLDVNWDDL